MRKLYMHTIAGIPATYYPGEQICYVRCRRGKLSMVSDITQIKREQRASNRWRGRNGYKRRYDYGHLCVYLNLPPAEPKDGGK